MQSYGTNFFFVEGSSVVLCSSLSSVFICIVSGCGDFLWGPCVLRCGPGRVRLKSGSSGPIDHVTRADLRSRTAADRQSRAGSPAVRIPAGPRVPESGLHSASGVRAECQGACRFTRVTEPRVIVVSARWRPIVVRARAGAGLGLPNTILRVFSRHNQLSALSRLR